MAGGKPLTPKSLFYSMLKCTSSSLWSTYFTFSFLPIIKARSKKRRKKKGSFTEKTQMKWERLKNHSRNISKIALPISRWNAAYLWSHVTTTQNNTMNFFHLSLSRSRNLAFVFINSLLPQTLGQLGKATALGTTLNILFAKSQVSPGKRWSCTGGLVPSGRTARENCLVKPTQWKGLGCGGGQSAKRVRLERRQKGSACLGKAVPGLHLLQCNHSLSYCSSHCSATVFGGFFH